MQLKISYERVTISFFLGFIWITNNKYMKFCYNYQIVGLVRRTQFI